MKYEERKKIVAKWLFDFLKRYEAPPHLDKEASKEEMLLMVEDINSECPNTNMSGLNLLLEEVSKYVRKNQSSRRWPTINMFVKALRENREKIKIEDLDVKVNDNFVLDPLKINARRIKSKDPRGVHDYYIIGKGAEELLKNNLVTEADLEPFRKYYG